MKCNARLPVLGLVVSMVTCVSVAHAAEFDLDAFASRLAALRAEVESLSYDIETRKDEERAALRSLAAQKLDLELAIQREERRVEQLDQAVAKQKEETAQAATSATGLPPVIRKTLNDLRTQVAAGIPFRKSERLAALDEIEDQLTQGMLPPQKVAARLWQHIEDELRLTRENGVYQQTITLGPEDVLVDIARLGMVAIYFRTTDGRVGYARPAGADWTWTQIQGPEEATQIVALFDAMKKQIRTGYFELPLALAGGYQ